MEQHIRWGIIGTGNIASQFAQGLESLSDARLVAVGSRTHDSAATFAKRFGATHAYGSYEELAHDANVDAVYIATPHTLHKENSLLCLNADKAVLCEKPFAINAAEANEVIELARERRLFLMEAMWSRFLPLLVRVRQLLAENAIGEVRMLTVDFGFRTDIDPQSRLFDPALGGGALLDVGIYPVSLASMIFGAPKRIATLAHLGETGMDEQAAIVMGYENGKIATLTTAIRTNTPQEALILGSNGSIKLPTPWWHGTTLTLEVDGKEPEQIELPYTGNGYNYEAAEVARCLRIGRLESDVMPLDETLAIIRTTDQIRAAWGLKYPMEY